MKKLLLSVCAFSLTLATLQAGEITKYVNPFIGTGAIDGGLSGNNYPGGDLAVRYDTAFSGHQRSSQLGRRVRIRL